MHISWKRYRFAFVALVGTVIAAGQVEQRFAAAMQNQADMASMETTEQPRPRRVLCFKAAWCGACQKLERSEFPILEKKGWKIGDDLSNHVQIIDVDQHPELVDMYGVEAMPTLVLVDEGRELTRRGYLSGVDIAKLYLNREYH